MRYMVGQRVLIYGREIGTVLAPPDGQPTHFGIWVYSPSRGYACDFALHNISPLPNGQL